MSNDDINFLDHMQQLLDQHDYEMPEIGDIRQGIIVAITQQGVIVDLGLKRDGLVPLADLTKLEPGEREALNVNDEIFVYVVNTDQPDSLTVSINLARLNQDWIEAEELLQSGKMIEAEVIGYNKGGAIVPYGRLRGFIPISHLVDLSPGMSDRKRQQKLAKLRGEKLPLKVIEVDRRRRRLVMSQRDAQREWEEKRKAELLADLKEGDTLRGRVSGLRDFGIFVDLGGADGLVHISELAWHRVDHPREVVKVGDEFDVYVLKLDRNGQRISLSRKRLLPNPWDTVHVRYALNQLVEGTVTRIVDYGAFAEIEPGVEGLLHVSQLSRGNVENVTEVIQEGETHLLRVVSIDSERQRIGLSLKAVTAMEQIEWMAQRELTAAESAPPAQAASDEAIEGEDSFAISDTEETQPAAQEEMAAAVAQVDVEAVVETTIDEAAVETTVDESDVEATVETTIDESDVEVAVEATVDESDVEVAVDLPTEQPGDEQVPDVETEDSVVEELTIADEGV